MVYEIGGTRSIAYYDTGLRDFMMARQLLLTVSKDIIALNGALSRRAIIKYLPVGPERLNVEQIIDLIIQ